MKFHHGKHHQAYVDNLNKAVDADPALAERKRRAIRAHHSQLAYTDFEHTILGLNAYRSMVHQRGVGFAEGLCALRW